MVFPEPIDPSHAPLAFRCFLPGVSGADASHPPAAEILWLLPSLGGLRLPFAMAPIDRLRAGRWRKGPAGCGAMEGHGTAMFHGTTALMILDDRLRFENGPGVQILGGRPSVFMRFRHFFGGAIKTRGFLGS